MIVLMLHGNNVFSNKRRRWGAWGAASPVNLEAGGACAADESNAVNPKHGIFKFYPAPSIFVLRIELRIFVPGISAKPKAAVIG